jgi:hypothetical protein
VDSEFLEGKSPENDNRMDVDVTVTQTAPVGPVPAGTRASLNLAPVAKEARWTNLKLYQDAYLLGPNLEELDPFPYGGTRVVQASLNSFSGLLGQDYLRFINARTTWINDFTNHWMPNDWRYGWLSPYQGNEHNRALFTQVALHMVLRWQHVDNRDHLPNLYEPFIGTGQVFLFADAFADPLLDPATQLLMGAPFGKLIAGDLNRYLIASYRAMQEHDDFVARYLQFADVWDTKLATNTSQAPAVFQEVVQLINGYGPSITDVPDAQLDLQAGCCYIWLVNRCVHSTTVSLPGVLKATLRTGANLVDVKKREQATLPNVCRGVRAANRSFCLADFALTTSSATDRDVVFMDCPFPTFSVTIPKDAKLISTASGVYGLDTASDLQQRILDEVARLVTQGTTVLLCNYANPDLVLAYSRLLATFGHTTSREFIYTYKSPSQDTIYQLVLFPGWGNHQQQTPTLIRNLANYLTKRTLVPE